MSTPTAAELFDRWERLRPECEVSIAALRETRLALEAQLEADEQAADRHNRKQALRVIKGGLDG